MVLYADEEHENIESVVARLWLERASDLLADSEGNPEILEQAGKAWETAGEFVSGNSDFFYLEAKLLLGGYQTSETEQSALREAYEQLALALDKTGENDFWITDFRSRAVLWSSLALRLKEYRALGDRYDQWPRGEKNDPVLIYAAARASLYLGLDERAGELALKGEALADSSTDLNELGNDFGSTMSAFHALAMAAGNRNAFIQAEPTSRRWPGMSEALLPWLLAGYFAADETAALKRVLDEKYHPVLEDLGWISAGVSRPSAAPPGRDLALARRLGCDLSKEYENFTGLLSSDANYDGYPEELIRMVNGKVNSRRIDSDQDGRYEWEFEYDPSGPFFVLYGNERLSVYYEKNAFPEILSVLAKNDRTAVTVSFNPGALSWDPTNGNPYWGKPAGPHWNIPEFWEAARNVTVEETAEEGFVRAKTTLSGGYPIFAQESGFLNENPDHPVWTRQILYRDGIPAAARRSFGTSRENPEKRIWEIYERYENGKMVGLAWDPGETGVPLYMKDWALESFFEIQAWDLNGDEWMDARRFLLPDGSESTSELMITEAGVEDLFPWKASDWTPWDK